MIWTLSVALFMASPGFGLRPEGDFSIEEVRLAMDNGFQSVSLGECRLRTETAALSAVMMSQLALRKRF